MILNIAVLLLVLAIAFINSLFGFFSGLINVMCATTAMCVAFGFAEPLNSFAMQQGLPGSISLPVIFLALFVLTHLVLRVSADNLIRGNVHLPRALDLGGAAVCGLVISLISVGVLVLAFLMLPWGSRVAMFSRYERTDDTVDHGGVRVVKFQRNSIWFKPDEFAARFFSMLAGGSLKGGTAFADVYPSYADWVSWTGNTVQPESATSPSHNSKADGFGTRGLGVQAWWAQKGQLAACYRAKPPAKDLREKDNPWLDLKYEPQPGKELIGMRLKLMQPAADQDEGARYHRFRPTMLRIVGQEKNAVQEYTPVVLGGVIPGDDRLRLVDVDNNFALASSGAETLVDAYFEVGEGFQPRFVEYRRFARSPLPKDKVAAAPDGNLTGAETAASKKDRIVGAASFMRAVVEEGTGSRAALPFPLAASKISMAPGVELKEGKLQAGRISGLVNELTGSGGGAVQEFVVPDKQGMFQLRFKAKEASSLAGKVFSFAASVTNQYIAVGKKNERYFLAGFYATVKRNGADYFELYIAGPEESAGSRGMLDFKQITRDELRSGETEIGLLFFVRKGEVITSVENQVGQGVEFKSPGYKIGG